MKLKLLILVTLCLVSLAGAVQLSFNSGQQSPLMKYRVDVDNHSMAAEELTNIMVRSKGMAHKRPGTEFIDNSLVTGNVRLFPWEHSTDDSYALEFSHNSIGFLRTVP